MNRPELALLAMCLCTLGCEEHEPARCEVPWSIPWGDDQRLATTTISLTIEWSQLDGDCGGDEREVELLIEPVAGMLSDDACEISIAAGRCRATGWGGNAGFGTPMAEPSPAVDSYVCGDFLWTAPGTFEGDAVLTRVERARPSGPALCTATGHVVLTPLEAATTTP